VHARDLLHLLTAGYGTSRPFQWSVFSALSGRSGHRMNRNRSVFAFRKIMK
jgi:hypothetical protein